MFIVETSMLKTLITLVRGRTALMAEEVADQNALLILDQQMRDATGALDRAKKALAVAIAQKNQEVQRLDATHSRIADLETRAIAAIEAGRDDLATEAAETIAALEGERDASLTARALFAAEIAKLKGHVLQQQMRFSQLERGRRIARAAEAVRVARRGRIEDAPVFAGTLAEAEATLARLREHQVEADTAEAAFEALDAATGPIAVAEKLSAEGFGPRMRPNVADVLARREPPGGMRLAERGEALVPGRCGEPGRADDCHLAGADGEAPGEAEDRERLEVLADAGEEGLRRPGHVVAGRPRRAVEERRRKAEEAEGVGHLAERLERVDRETAGRVGGVDELDPTERVGVAAGVLLDRRPAVGQAARALRAAEFRRVDIGRDLDPHRPRLPRVDEIDPHRGSA